MYLKNAFLFLSFAVALAHSYNISILYEWTQIEYEFDSDDDRTAAISNGTFDVGQIQPIDVQYTYVESATTPERIFITTPRLSSGTPAVLSVITDSTLDGNPVVKPYPSWSWHLDATSCPENRIVSVFRVRADQCNRLWVMDNGINGASFACAPQLLAFDLETDELLYRYELPYDQYQNASWYLSPVVEDDTCDDTWVYVADPIASTLLVYSLAQNTSWRVQDSSFDPDEDWETFTIDGGSFTQADGIITAALSPASDGDDRKLYFHAMAGVNESYGYLKDLKNFDTTTTNVNSTGVFSTYEKKRDDQSCVEAFDSNGNLYFSLLSSIEIAKWNSSTVYETSNFEIIGNNSETMQFPSGLKVDAYGDGEALWFFATAFQRYASGTLSSNETNFRIHFTEL